MGSVELFQPGGIEAQLSKGYSPASISNRSKRQTGDPALLLKGHSSHWFAVRGGTHPITGEKLIMRFRNRPNRPRVVS